MRHIVITLESPMMSFGGEVVDNIGVTQRFPAASMLTGMFASSLGWRRSDKELLQRMQNSLVFAARIDREPATGEPMTDYQMVDIGRKDKGWTTRGVPQERTGSASTYARGTHRRYRDYYTDMLVTAAVRLECSDQALPTLDDLAQALTKPFRPLFIGRKGCVPSGRIFQTFVDDSGGCLSALLAVPLNDEDNAADTVALMWPDGESVPGIHASHSYMVTDERDWVSDMHGGSRIVHEGQVNRDAFQVTTDG